MINLITCTTLALFFTIVSTILIDLARNKLDQKFLNNQRSNSLLKLRNPNVKLIKPNYQLLLSSLSSSIPLVLLHSIYPNLKWEGILLHVLIVSAFNVNMFGKLGVFDKKFLIIELAYAVVQAFGVKFILNNALKACQ